MTITIDQTKFEAAVPAMRNATNEVFTTITGYIEEAKAEVLELIGTLTIEEETEELRSRATRLVCLMAAHRAMPHLDLVLTPTGFGVVSNQNVAPASRERVAALAERLRRDKSTERDLLLFALLRTSWRNSPMAAATLTSLLWCPMLCRRYGITLDGAEVYEAEHEALKPHIAEAESLLAERISPELLSALITHQYTTPDVEAATYALLQEKCRRIIAVKLSARLKPYMMDDLLDTVRRYRHLLPEYDGSSTAAAHDFKPYENKKEDGTFFFG